MTGAPGRRIGHMAALCLAAAVAVACGPATPTRGSSAAPNIIPNPAVSFVRYACGRFPFGAEVLDITREDELAATPAAAALRGHLAASGPDFEWLPDHGWTLVGTDATGAEFVAVTGGDPGMVSVAVEPAGGAWKVTGWGQCRPTRVLPDGLGSADWWLPEDRPKPGPNTRTFEALVMERDCASGRPADGRIVGPDVEGVNSLVLVTFAVRPLGGLQTCPSNPATRVTVDLGEPLGTRTLLDGGTLPPREPVAP
jgi:hypothetical protein